MKGDFNETQPHIFFINVKIGFLSTHKTISLNPLTEKCMDS